MDTGLPRLEFEAHGRIASAVAKTRENRASYDKNQRNSAFQAPFYRPGRFKTDRLLGIDSCNALFGKAADLVQTASVLSNPVFVNGENYNGTPNMIRHPLLKEQLLTHFGQMAKSLPNALFIPLGDKVAEAMHFIADQKMLDRRCILDGLPHPSGANAERIAYFLGKKQRKDLSAKTNPEKLDQARQSLIAQINALI